MAGDDVDDPRPEGLILNIRSATPVWVLPPDPPGAAVTSPRRDPFSRPQIIGLLCGLALLTAIAFMLWGVLARGAPFWVIWLATIWPLPLAGLINGRRRRARPNGLPAEYRRTEYRDGSPPAGPKVIGHCSR